MYLTPESPSTNTDLTYYLKPYSEQTGATRNDTLKDFHYVNEDVNPTWLTITMSTLYGIKYNNNLRIKSQDKFVLPSGLYIFQEGSKCNIFILVHENKKL
jgi:hypothetical protein